MEVSIIAIGNELLIGQVVDTNSGDIARIMADYGWSVDNVQVVSDSAADITSAIHHAMERTDVVLTTGGLGPTKDDITKRVLMQLFGGELREDSSVLENIREVFRKRGLQLNDLTRAQALVPTSCTVIQNRVGTAPVMWFERPDGKVLVAMPGVPFETRHVFPTEVLPRLLEKFGSDTAIAHATIQAVNVTESALATRLAGFEERLPSHLSLAYLPKPGLIRLRLDGRHSNAHILARDMCRYKEELIDLVGPNFLVDEDISPEDLLLRRLRAHGYSVGSAESCTGGEISRRIVAIPGCSDVMRGAVVAYSNDVKISVLGVDPNTLSAHGAVSEEVALQMAEGACRALGADCAMATSGIAGPDGGTPEKPVGTVCIAVTTPHSSKVATYHFPGSRDRVIDRAATTALLNLISLL